MPRPKRRRQERRPDGRSPRVLCKVDHQLGRLIVRETLTPQRTPCEEIGRVTKNRAKLGPVAAGPCIRQYFDDALAMPHASEGKAPDLRHVLKIAENGPERRLKGRVIGVGLSEPALHPCFGIAYLQQELRIGRRMLRPVVAGARRE